MVLKLLSGKNSGVVVLPLKMIMSTETNPTETDITAVGINLFWLHFNLIFQHLFQKHKGSHDENIYKR